MATIWIIVTIKPSMAPKTEKASFKETIRASVKLWPAVFLVLVVIVGLWGGIFSPSEAGGIGALLSLIIIFIRKGFAWKDVFHGMKATTETSAMIFTIVIGAMIFSDFITLSGLATAMVNFLKELTLPSYLILIIIMLIYLFLGCIMDSLAMVLITLPIVFPVITNLGIDPVFFGILLVINIEASLITPPVGMVAYIIAGMAKEISLGTVFKGIMPFVGSMVICIALIMIFPQIALWLPNSMIK